MRINKSILSLLFVITLLINLAHATDEKGVKYKDLNLRFDRPTNYWSLYPSGRREGEIKMLEEFIEPKLSQWQDIHFLYYVPISEENYAVYFDTAISQKNRMEYFKLHEELSRTGKQVPVVSRTELALVNITRNIFEPIYMFPKKLGFSEANEPGLLWFYGCKREPQHVISKTDINLDGKADVFLFTEFSDVHPRAGSYRREELRIIDPGARKQRLQITVFEANVGEGPDYPNKYSMPAFTIINPKTGKSQWYLSGLKKDRPEVQPGKVEYTKLFFIDIDEDDLLDVFVWRHRFEGGESGDVVREIYQRLEESGPHAEFVEQAISDEQVKDIKNKFNLKWVDGIPNTKICDERTPDSLLTTLKEKRF